MNELYIITGASKGIGAALAEQLEREGHSVLRIARSNPEKRSNLLTIDITQAHASDQMVTWIQKHLASAQTITLINNAGTVEPIGLVGTLEVKNLPTALLLNVAAPIAFTNAFVATLMDYNLPKYVLNISSGAGRKPYSGWSVYCATKAALDHFTQVLMHEQQTARYPVQVSAIAPGIIDTHMQHIIRNSKIEQFPMVKNFQAYKEEGRLASPEDTARALLAYLHSDKMGTSSLTDIRE